MTTRQIERCGATCRDGTPCGRWPAKGQTRCKLHGGGSPQAKRKAAERQVETKLQAQLDTRGAATIDDPIQWLQTIAGEVDQWLALCRGQLAKSVDIEQSDALIRLYERALHRALEAAATMAKIGIDTKFIEQHQARLNDQQGQILIRVVERAIAGALAAVDARLDRKTIGEIITDAIDAEANGPQTITTIGRHP